LNTQYPNRGGGARR